MNRVLIVPGLNNSGPGHWQTEWEKRLPCSRRISLDNWSTPNLNAWVDAIENAAARFAPTHIVAHSFGVLASALVAANRIDSLQGVFFVAPADPDKFGVRHLLPPKTLSVPGILIGSLSDPWLSWDGVRELAARWNLHVECAGNAGHINAQSGHGQWPEGWRDLHNLLDRAPVDDGARSAPRVLLHASVQAVEQQRASPYQNREPSHFGRGPLAGKAAL